MSIKSDPFFSINTMLKKSVPIECRQRWHDKPYLFGGLNPNYFWGSAGYSLFGLLRDQLTTADAMGWLEWELVNEHSVLELTNQLEASENKADSLLRWSKRLVAFRIPDCDIIFPPTDRPKLGDRRLVTAKASRHKSRQADVHGNDHEIARWRSRLMPTPIEATFVGFRSVYEGKIVRSNSEDGGGAFYVARTLEMWKFVDNPRHNDYYVFPQDVKIKEES